MPDQCNGHFRFLDLPAEIRNKIYAFIAKVQGDDDYHYLDRVRLPNITKVSSQIRTEALPVFFESSQFEIFVLCDFAYHAKLRFFQGARNSATAPRLLYGDCETAGDLGLSGRTWIIVGLLDKVARFKNVKFCLWESPALVAEARHERAVSRPQKTQPVAWLSIQVLDVGNNRHEVSSDMYHGPSGGAPVYASFEIMDVMEALRRASAVARKFTARDGFAGFSLADIIAIAGAFRFDAMTA